jgi:hypothetical protein
VPSHISQPLKCVEVIDSDDIAVDSCKVLPTIAEPHFSALLDWQFSVVVANAYVCVMYVCSILVLHALKY